MLTIMKKCMRIDKIQTSLYTYLFYCIILFFTACTSSSESFEQAPNGLLYTFRVKSNSANTPKQGDRVLVRIRYFAHDSLIFDSREISSRFIQEIPEYNDSVPTIFQAYMFMSEGDSLTCKIAAKDFYSQLSIAEYPQGIAPHELLRFEIRLEKIFNPHEFLSEEERILHDLSEQEQYLLQEYIQSHYPEQKPTKSGMYYIEKKAGNGKKPHSDAQLIIHYSISFLDGHVLYSTASANNPLRFSIQDTSVWPGLTEGVQYMREGGLATFILPSELAAGKKGENPIPPCKTIIVRVQLLKVL